MNQIDVNKSQYQLYGNNVQLQKPETDKHLFRDLIAEMSKSGRIEEALAMICDTIEDMQKKIKELEEK